MATSKLGFGLFGASIVAVATGCGPTHRARAKTLHRHASFFIEETGNAATQLGRRRGEEGSMGNPNIVKRRYAVAGPQDNPDPFASRVAGQMPEWDRNLQGAIPLVRMGASTRVGRLPPEVIQKVVRENMGRFSLCFEAAFRNNPPPFQTVTVGFTIERDGSVNKVQTTSENTSASVATCVGKAFRSVVFPKPEGGTVKVSYPIRVGI
jgi:hypothetical protein